MGLILNTFATMNFYKLLLSFLLLGIMNNAFTQVSVKDSIVFAPIIDFTYSYKAPGGDMEKRFGNHSEIGLAFLIKTKKNFFYGIDWNYMFGSTVNELGFTDGFRDANGGILAVNGLYSEVYFTERGFTLSARFGQMFNLLAANPNSGVVLMGGIGFLQHRIKIEDKFNEVPLLSGDDYSTGYDRLSNGILFTEFVGYRLLSSRRLINLFGGFEFTQGLTKNRRSVNFDTGTRDTKQRLDLTMGFRVGFSLPLYKPTPKEFYYR